MRQTQQRTNVLGIGISATTLEDATSTMQEWIEHGEKHYVCVTGVHGVIESLDNPSLRRIHNDSGLTVPDGMPMVWLSRLKGHREVRRVYGPDLMLAMCAKATQSGYTHFLYGGAPGVAEKLMAHLQDTFPGIQIVGTYSPPFRPLTAPEEAELAQRFAEIKPNLVWVGLGTPKQELWMAEHLSQLSCNVMVGVGAAFDFHTGRVRQAPLWMRKSGLEWFFRLTQEPKRLWRRYIIGNTRFIFHIFQQGLGLRKFPIESGS